MSEPFNAIQVVMMPRDTNPFGTHARVYPTLCGNTPVVAGNSLIPPHFLLLSEHGIPRESLPVLASE
jgi:hypothetical protein